MAENRISVIDAASCLGRQKQHVFKVLKRLGIVPEMAPASRSRGQRVAYLSEEQFRSLEAALGSVDGPSGEPGEQATRHGAFYLIQLEPVLEPGRFKLGFASNLEERLRAHKVAAPLCRVVKTWPCRLLWEKTAIESVARGCERVHTEVFRAPGPDGLDAITRRADAFFALMPEVPRRPP